MNFFCTIFICIFFISCFRDSPNVVVVNSSDKAFDSIQIYASPKNITSFKNVKLKSKHSSQIIFDKSITSDGAYTLKLFHKDTVSRYVFGYYTNGSSLNTSFLIKVKNDTILVKSDCHFCF
jgi:hypothetical protein